MKLVWIDLQGDPEDKPVLIQKAIDLASGVININLKVKPLRCLETGNKAGRCLA